MEYKQVDCSHG